MYEERSNTTIVLHFNGGHVSTRQAHDSSDIRFRRKSNNSVKRDQMRAKEYYEKKMKVSTPEEIKEEGSEILQDSVFSQFRPFELSESVSGECHVDMFESSLPSSVPPLDATSPVCSKDSAVFEAIDSDNRERSFGAACAASFIDKEGATGGDRGTIKLCSSSEEQQDKGTDDGGGVALSEEAAKLGFRLSEVERNVREIPDTMVLKDLKNVNRNSYTLKSVLDKRKGNKIIISESDDIILHYDMQHKEVVFWFIKLRSKKFVGGYEVVMESETVLKRWPPLDDDDPQFNDARQHINHCFRVLMSAMQPYLH